MANQQVDVLIIGGGLIGATLLLALQGLGVTTLLVEQKSLHQSMACDFDARSLALSPTSQRIMNQLGLWRILSDYATPIDSIHVSQQFHFGSARLDKATTYPLGYVVEMPYIAKALAQLVSVSQLIAPAQVTAIDANTHEVRIKTATGVLEVQARLIVAADGTQSTVRQLCHLIAQEKEYNQQAIVANIGLTRAHHNQAFERFTTHGPLALLPLSEQRMSLVWAMLPKDAHAVMSLSDAQFLQRLQQSFGYRLGRLIKVGTRSTYSLKQVLTPEYPGPIIFVGNAAHTLHPVAGQGFNLGLRDVAALAQAIASVGLGQNLKPHYTQLRAADHKAIIQGTNWLIQLFSQQVPGLSIARGLGLVALDNQSYLKKILTYYGQGFGGVVPDLACMLDLERK